MEAGTDIDALAVGAARPVDDELDSDATAPDPGSAVAPGPDLAELAPGPGAAPGSSGPPASGLSDRDRQVLAFERQWWRHAGSKEQAIRDTFAVSPTRYYQLLNTLLDHPAATEHDPMLVGRLRRLRATRSRRSRR